MNFLFFKKSQSSLLDDIFEDCNIKDGYSDYEEFFEDVKNSINIKLILLFYQGKTNFFENHYLKLINSLNFLDNKRLSEVIIYAKYNYPNIHLKLNGDLSIYVKNFKIDNTLLLSFCRYNILHRIKEYLTDENKKEALQFSICVNALNSIEYLKNKGIKVYKIITNLNIKKVVYMWFDDNQKCKELYGNISYWDLTNVTDMKYLFYNYTSFNEDISNWNVSNVTDMSNMFHNAEKFNCDLSNWNVKKVRLMSGMFNNAPAFNSDLSKWNVKKVIVMNHMFCNTQNFNCDLSNWNVKNVTDMSYMFFCSKKFNSDLSNWKTKKLTNTKCMFRNAINFNGNISNWNTKNVQDMSYMFYKAKNFNQDISNWNTKNVQNMSYMFFKAKNFNSDVSNWNVSNVQNMSYMFFLCTNFIADISKWNISNTCDISFIIFGMEKLDKNIKTKIENLVNNTTTSRNKYFEILVAFML